MLAEHRRRLFSDELFADLFGSGRARPSVPSEVIGSVLVLQALEGRSDRATGFDKLVSRSLLRTDSTGTEARDPASRAELFEAVAAVFGLTLDDLDETDRDLLWQRAQAGHEQWLREREAPWAVG